MLPGLSVFRAKYWPSPVRHHGPCRSAGSLWLPEHVGEGAPFRVARTTPPKYRRSSLLSHTAVVCRPSLCYSGCLGQAGNIARPYLSGRSAAWLARLVRDQEVEGSNPFAPTISCRTNNLQTQIYSLTAWRRARRSAIQIESLRLCYFPFSHRLALLLRNVRQHLELVQLVQRLH